MEDSHSNLFIQPTPASFAFRTDHPSTFRAKRRVIRIEFFAAFETIDPRVIEEAQEILN
jgi:hypothetical protein